MKKGMQLRKRKYKVNPKMVSPIDHVYNRFSKMWSETFGKASDRMTIEEFLMDADMRGIDLYDSKKLLRAAEQRVASAAHLLTNTQAKNLKRELLNLTDKDLEEIGFSREDIKSMTLEAYKFLPNTGKGKAMISKFYELLKLQGLTVKEAGEWISAEIYGS